MAKIMPLKPMSLRLSIALLSLLCFNVLGNCKSANGKNLTAPIKNKSSTSQDLQLDSNSIKLKGNLKKRGIAFTDSLIYLKQIIAAKGTANDFNSFKTLNEELRKKAIAYHSDYFLAEYYLNDGRLKQHEHKLAAATQSVFKALHLSEKFASIKEQVRYYKLLTNIFFELRDGKKLLFYANKAHQLQKKQKELNLLADVHMALPYVVNGKSDTALKMLSKCEKSIKMKVPVYAFSVYLYQSHAYYRLGKYNESVERLAKAEVLDKQAEMVIPNLSIHRKHGLILTLVAMKNYRRARQEFEKNIDNILKLMDWDDRREVFEAAAKLYEALGDDKKALKYFREYEIYKDSVNNLATKKLVNDLEIKYQTSLKEKAIANQKIQLVEKDNQLQKNERHIKTILSILVLLILCAIIYHLVTKNKVQAIQLNQLKSQIHPHFLFNALNSLYSLSISKSDDAPGVVIGISNILRYILYECNGPSVSLGKELDVIQEYIKLEKMRRKDNVEVNINIAPDLDSYKIAPLLLLPLVENSYKHGVNKLLEDAWINIQAKVVNGRCIFKISNNKPLEESDKKNATPYGNIGLQNIRKRLRILYPNKHSMEILQSEDVFIVSIEVCVTNSN